MKLYINSMWFNSIPQGLIGISATSSTKQEGKRSFSSARIDVIKPMRHTPLSSGARVADIPQRRTKLISTRVFPASLIQIRKRKVNVAAEEVYGASPEWFNPREQNWGPENSRESPHSSGQWVGGRPDSDQHLDTQLLRSWGLNEVENVAQPRRWRNSREQC